MKPTTRDGILRGGIAVLIRMLLLTAAGISAYLLSVSLSGGAAVGCGPGSGCDEVLKSRWAYFLGVPVSALALIVDLTLLFLTFACGTKSSPKQRRGSWEIIVPGAIIVLGSALWFVALQAFVVQRFCPWCMAAHICGALAAVLLLMRVPVTVTPDKSEKSPALRQSTVVKLAVMALLAVGIMGVAQSLVTRKTYTVTAVPESSANVSGTAAPVAQAVSSQTNAAPSTTNAVAVAPTPPPAVASNVFTVFGGQFTLDMERVPVIGSPKAPLRMLSLFDYTCHHCREMHEHVIELHRQFSNSLAIVSLPMPLDGQCNRIMTRGTPPAHANACVYARIGLAVWKAKPSALVPFDDWIFAAPTWQPPVKRAPPLTEVTNKAVELIGAMMFEKAMRDPWVEQQVQMDIDMYEASYKQFRNGSMPQFLIGTNLVTGTIPLEQMRMLIDSYVRALPR